MFTTQNVNNAELEKFSDMANQWWEPEGPCAPLHALNPARLQFILSKTDLTNKKIIDVGCGGGILSESLAKEGGTVTGIDANLHLIEIAQQHAQNADLNIQYHHCAAEEYLHNNSQQFDVLTCLELLEHVPDSQQLIHACHKLLKPTGIAFFSTLHRTAKSFLLAIVGAEYLCRLLPKGTHDYQQFIRPSELSYALKQAGMELQDLSGIRYTPWSKSAVLHPDVSVNYIAYAVCQSNTEIS